MVSAESFAILHESAETFRELPGFSRAPATLAAQAGVNLGEPWMIHGLIHLFLDKWWLMLWLTVVNNGLQWLKS